MSLRFKTVEERNKRFLGSFKQEICSLFSLICSLVETFEILISDVAIILEVLQTFQIGVILVTNLLSSVFQALKSEASAK